VMLASKPTPSHAFPAPAHPATLLLAAFQPEISPGWTKEWHFPAAASAQQCQTSWKALHQSKITISID